VSDESPKDLASSDPVPSDADSSDAVSSDSVSSDSDSSDAVSLEERINRLELILTRLESDEIPLEQALELFEEGIGHVREAERVLSETQLRVEELLAGGKTRELDVDEP